jgi:hypothetical protein
MKAQNAHPPAVTRVPAPWRRSATRDVSGQAPQATALTVRVAMLTGTQRWLDGLLELSVGAVGSKPSSRADHLVGEVLRPEGECERLPCDGVVLWYGLLCTHLPTHGSCSSPKPSG